MIDIEFDEEQGLCEFCSCTSVCQRDRAVFNEEGDCAFFVHMPSREKLAEALNKIACCEFTCLDDRDPYCEVMSWDGDLPQTPEEAIGSCWCAGAASALGYEVKAPEYEED